MDRIFAIVAGIRDADTIVLWAIAGSGVALIVASAALLIMTRRRDGDQETATGKLPKVELPTIPAERDKAASKRARRFGRKSNEQADPFIARLEHLA